MDVTPTATIPKADSPADTRPCAKVPTYGQQHLPPDRKGVLRLPRLGTEVRFESSVEEDALYCFDADPEVQSVRRADLVRYHDYRGEAHDYDPDFRVERLSADGSLISSIYECKPWALLPALLSNDPLTWQTRRAALQADGLPLIMLTDRDLDGPRLEHARTFGGHVHSVPEPDLYSRLTGELQTGALSLQALKDRVKLRVPASLQTSTWQLNLLDTLHGLIARGEMHADRTSLPGGDCRVWLASMAEPTELAPLGQDIEHYLRLSQDGWKAEPTPPAWTEDDQHHLAEQRLLATPRGQAWLKLFSLYSDPHVRLDADLVEALHGQTGHSRQTLFRFRRLLLQHGAPGITFRPLVPALTHGFGHRPTRTVEDRVSHLIQERIDAWYLVSVGTSHRYETVANLHQEIGKACIKEKLSPPAYTTVKRALDRLYADDPVGYVTRRDGAEEAAKLKGRLGTNIFTAYGELLAVDFTPCDVFNRKDEIEVLPVPKGKQARKTARQRRDWTERATMVVWSEAATSEVVLSDLIHGHPTAAVVLDGFRRVMQRDQALQRAMGVQELSPFIGLPAKVRMDSGSEFKNEDVKRVLRSLGITLVQRNRSNKHNGGMEERTIGTLVRAHHILPGTTMHAPGARREYNAQKGAVLSFELLSRYHQLTVEQHNADHAPGRGVSRHAHALQLIEEGRVRLKQATPDQRRFLQEQMLPHEHRTCQREGIEWAGLRYSSSDPEFERLIQNRAQVEVLHHPDDIRTARIVHPKNGRLLDIQARPPDGLSFDEPVPLSVWKVFKQARDAQQKVIKSRKKSPQELFDAATAGHTARTVSVPSRPDRQPRSTPLPPVPSSQEQERPIVASTIAFVPIIRTKT